MKIRVEASVDLDANRKVWIHGEAEDFEPEQLEETAQTLAQAVTDQALGAYTRAAAALGIVPLSAEAVMASAGLRTPPSERRPRPEDPESMRTFGDDDDEDDDGTS